jgi:hypothetical protein
MRLTPVAWSLVGSLVVFAACAVQTAEHAQEPSAHTDSGVSAVVDAFAAEVHAVADAVSESLGVDVSFDVHDAKAEPDASTPQPTVLVVPCQTTGNVEAGNITRFADAQVPGRTALDLSRAIVVFTRAKPDLDGFTHFTLTGSLTMKDGLVRSTCPDSAPSLTFIIPPPLTP